VAERECSVRETEQLVRKAMEAPDEPGAAERAAPVVSELLKTRTFHVQLHQRAAGSASWWSTSRSPIARCAGGGDQTNRRVLRRQLWFVFNDWEARDGWIESLDLVCS